ncbi:MAG: ArsR/SmtB family transcription factor [Planctomycetota bacterium]
MARKLDLLPAQILAEAAECLRVLAHPIRLRIVDILMQGQFPVGEIAKLCQVQPNQTSEHLRLLKGHGLLDSERRGRAVFYKIADPRLPGLLKCIRQCCAR